jgi:pyruvate,orthophosphate dikinase
VRLVRDTLQPARRGTRPKLKIGICGEQGGEPTSVEFCHAIGLDYVSCSPFRVPIARLAAAQAVLREKKAAAKGAPKRVSAKKAPAKKTRKRIAKKPGR